MSGEWEELTPKKVGGGWEELTPGGAAVGNPNIRRQGDKSIRNNRTSLGEVAADVGGATAIGGVLGALSSEIATGAGNVIGALPYPAARTVGGFLRGAGQAIGAGGRAAPAIAGALAGAGAESAGQVADMTTYGQENPAVGEATRFIAGGVTAESANLIAEGLRRYVITPSFTVLSKLQKEGIKAILGKFDNAPQSVTNQEYAYAERLLGEIRGAPKSDASLQVVGDALEEQGSRGIVQAARGTEQARQQSYRVGKVAPVMDRELSDIGSDLRNVITSRHSEGLEARNTEYKTTERLRDAMVKMREDAGGYINKTPEYEALVASIKEQTKGRSPEVQKNFEHILAQISPQEGRATFQQIDDVRRKLGEVFAGRPAEGYDSIGADVARRYYGQLSDLQKKFVGGAEGPQQKLLDDYARRTEGLSPFLSKSGKKATALDRMDDSKFATDPSDLPRTYFKSAQSVRDLKELTNDSGLVNRSALEYANRELSDATPKQVRAWMDKHSEMLRELPLVSRTINQYATKLEGAERATLQASMFADDAARTNATLVGKDFPKERIVNLVQNGNADMWAKAGPALAATQEGRANTLAAVKQVIADQPLKADDFARRIKPALINARLADNAAVDLIEKRLRMIEEMKIPESEKLSMKMRFALQAIGGYAASGMARGAVEAAKMVPD